jgi:hypothetical protein
MTRAITRHALFSAVFLIGCGGATLGGSDSNAADGGTTQDGGTPINNCVSTCIDGDLSWQQSGGLADATESSTLATCAQYTHQESSQSGDLSCTDTLVAVCAETGPVSGITAGNVAAAFENPDVTAAFAGSTQLYGSDPRGCDGSVLAITYQGKTIDVGGDCSEANNCGAPSTACVQPAPGLNALAKILVSLDAQEIKTKNCASVFPGR